MDELKNNIEEQHQQYLAAAAEALVNRSISSLFKMPIGESWEVCPCGPIFSPYYSFFRKIEQNIGWLLPTGNPGSVTDASSTQRLNIV